MPEIQAHLGRVFIDVVERRLEPGVATAAASVARTLNDLIKTGEIEERLQQLEQAAGIDDRRRA